MPSTVRGIVISDVRRFPPAGGEQQEYQKYSWKQVRKNMGKIFYMMGKSSSGKDTIFKEILKKKELNLHQIVLYTTRPARANETDGVQYHFVDEKRLSELQDAGKVIELRAYQVVGGVWKYFTVDDGRIDLSAHSYLYIVTLEGYQKIQRYFGSSRVVPIYIEVEDGERLLRAIARERQQKTPQYEEMCRRFLADAADFSEEKLTEAGITRRFINKDMEGTIREITEYIRQDMSGTKKQG